MRIYCSEFEASHLLEEISQTIPDSYIDTKELILKSQTIGTIAYFKRHRIPTYIVDVTGVLKDYINGFVKLSDILDK